MAPWSPGLYQLKPWYRWLTSILMEPCLLKTHDIQLVNLLKHIYLELAEASNVHTPYRNALGGPSLNTSCSLAALPMRTCSPTSTSTDMSKLLLIHTTIYLLYITLSQ